MLGVLTLAVVWLALVCGPPASAQESFRLLGEKEIRLRVVGKDITDASHWSMYLRPDGTLLSDEMGRKWTGIWKIKNRKLCMSNSADRSLNCKEVWMSGDNIRLRQHEDEETFNAIVASCNKECREFHEACVQNHSQAACKVDYDICVKHCRK
jgi:hypothetical protein